MTYTSTDAGPPQVFVTSFPDGRGRWPISTTGGDEARSRRDGKELYFLSRDQRLMAVPVKRRRRSLSVCQPRCSTRG